MDFSNYLLVSDVDGTLMLEDGTVPQNNIEAIRYYMQHGGMFTLATGRSFEKTQEVLQYVNVNFPGIFYNGGRTIDVETGEVLDQLLLTESDREYIEEIIREFQGISVMVLTESDYCMVKETEVHAYFISQERIGTIRRELNEIKEPVFKALFILDPQKTNDFVRFVQRKKYPGVRFVGSAEYMVEMLPERSSKGAALKKLAEDRGISRQNIVAVGDYFNDLEMLQYAGIGAAVGNAPDELKQYADIVLGSFQDGVMPHLIQLIQDKLKGYNQ